MWKNHMAEKRIKAKLRNKPSARPTGDWWHMKRNDDPQLFALKQCFYRGKQQSFKMTMRTAEYLTIASENYSKFTRNIPKLLRNKQEGTPEIRMKARKEWKSKGFSAQSRTTLRRFAFPLSVVRRCAWEEPSPESCQKCTRPPPSE